MDYIRKTLKLFLGRNRSASGRRLQEQLDVFRLSLLVERRVAGLTGSTKLDKLDSAAIDAIRGRELEVQRDSLHTRVHEQVVVALAALHDEWTLMDTPERRKLERLRKEGEGGLSGDRNGDGDNKASNPDNWNFTSTATSDARSEVSDKERAAAVADGVRSKLGFSLHVASSSIPGAGRGLYLRGSAPAGTVVCLYPGVVYLPLDLTNVKTPEEVEATFGVGNNNLLSRFDGTVIDANDFMVPDDPRPALENPFASGQFINHASTSAGANVLSCSYNFPSDEKLPDGFPKHLHPYMPNRYAVPPGLVSLLQTNGAVGMSVAFVTTRDVADEELLANYRLNPNLGLPEWYTPIDEDEDARRWG